MNPEHSVTPATNAATLPNPGDYVDTREAARILGVSEKSMTNWRWRGEGPRYRRIGARLVRYHRADLAAFAAGKFDEAVA
ncbi:MAG: DNA-binding protein [Rhodanobacteraceae bacterium]|nr:MAG: DNA-binding protein [Rhodanobacteraceae bacterium]